MKAGIVISVVILAIVAGVLIYFLHTPAADPPTQLTSAKNLEKVNLPDGLPNIFTVDSPAADANAAYQQALDYCVANRDDFVDGHGGINADMPPAKGDELANLLITASKAGKVTTPFLDNAIPFEPGGVPTFGDALETTADTVLIRARKIYENGDTARAIAAVEAVWALGQRALQQSVRLYPRMTGLHMMINAGQTLSEWNDKLPPDLADKLGTWGDALLKLRDAWEPKLTLVRAVHPHQGDLINMARHEQDLGLRTEAVIAIGVSKFSPNHKGNAVAFEEVLSEAKADNEPMIREAAAAAESFTRDQLHRMR